MKLAISLAAVFLCIGPVFAQSTTWQSPTTGGDWFDPNNWSSGVPTPALAAEVSGPGEARINSGLAESLHLLLGWQADGQMTQVGGAYKVNWDTVIGDDHAGQYSLMGGLFETNILSIRRTGIFQQTGGVCRVDELLRVKESAWASLYPPPSARYELIGGQLETSRVHIGTDGKGLFRQLGGVHSVGKHMRIGGDTPYWEPIIIQPFPHDLILPGPIFFHASVAPREVSLAPAGFITNFWLPPPMPTKGDYELAGGILNCPELEIGRTGTFEQTGGINNTGFLSIATNGEYRLFGGSLAIETGLEIKSGAQMDLGGAAVSISGGGIINLSRGGLLNSQAAHLTAGENSLTIFAEGFDPQTQLASFHSDGLVHFAGNDLSLTADQGFAGRGSVDDHVISSGAITASPGGGIDLNSGLLLETGHVDLGDGKLTVANNRSGIRDGELRTGNMEIGQSSLFVIHDPSIPYPSEPSRSVFQQTDGDVSVSDQLTIQGGGVYELHGGQLLARNVYISQNSKGSAGFIQTGGSVDIEGTLHFGERLQIQHWFGAHIYNAVPDQIITEPIDYHAPTPRPEPTATYMMTGGQLNARRISVSSWRGPGFFVQAGGQVITEEVTISDSDSAYTMLGGKLQTEELTIWSGSLGIMSADASIRITDHLRFERRAELTAVRGAKIHMDGADFLNWSHDSDAVSGLSNLSLIFDGGLDVVSSFEVAGRDMGDSLEGFFDNFLLDTLQVGGEISASVELLDRCDNQLDYEGIEALYVKNLIITEGSVLELNGLNIYYLNADIAEGGLITGGLALQESIPEPATFTLLIIGSTLLMRRRRR